jgi:hypothetical protein
MLQNAIANRPENNALMVSLLAGEIVVLPWDDPVFEDKFRIPVPRVKDAAGLKTAVQSLGKPGGSPLPRMDTDALQKRYADAVRRFQDHVAKQPEADLAYVVKSFEDAAVDWTFYREHADWSADFRQSIAWAYSESGREEDAPKAAAVAEGFLGGPIAANEATEAWWRAQMIRLRAFVVSAERAPGGGGAPSGTAAQWLERAAKAIKSLSAVYTDMGESAVPDARVRWQTILTRLNAARTKAGLPPVAVDLTAKRASPAPSPPDGEPPSNGGADGNK